MALSFLQPEQLLLKHRVVEIQPDAAFRLNHSQGESGFHLDGHPLVGKRRTRPSQPAGLLRQRVRVTSAHCLESLWRCERSRHPAQALPPGHGDQMERGSHCEPYTPQAAGGRARWWKPRTGRRLTGARGAKRHQRKEPRQDAKMLNMTLNNLKREA